MYPRPTFELGFGYEPTFFDKSNGQWNGWLSSVIGLIADSYFDISIFSQDLPERVLEQHKSLRMNILISNSFELKILRARISSAFLFSIFAEPWGRGVGQQSPVTFPNWEGVDKDGKAVVEW